MARGTRAAFFYRTVTNETEDAPPEKVDEALKITEELDELRAEKEEKFDHNVKQDKKSQTNDALIGYVTDIEFMDSYTRKVFLTVEFVDGEDKKKNEFEFSFPSSADQYSTDNDLVRLLLYFSEKGMDATGLLNREVWVKKKNGNYELHVPEKVSRASKAKHSIWRELVSRGWADWDGFTPPTRISTFTKMAGVTTAVAGIALLLTTRISEIGFALLADDLAASGVILLFLTVPFAIMAYGIGEIKEIGKFELNVGVFYLTFGLVLTTAIAVFNVPLTPPEAVPDGATSTIENISYTVAMVALGISGVILASQPVLKAVIGTRKKIQQIRQKYKRKKGIEYVDDKENL